MKDNKYTLNAPFKMRNCIVETCKKPFLSTGPHHRMCNNCRQKTDSGIETHKVHI